MSTSETPWLNCEVCGDPDHSYHHHLRQSPPPDFVHTSVATLQKLEREGQHLDSLISELALLRERETGVKKAWAIWLVTLLQEIEDYSDVPDVAAQIEEYLVGGYSD